MAQAHWANMDYRSFISLIGMVRNKDNNELMAIGTYADMDKEWAEVAFVVREDFHGQGIACHLLKELEKIARSNGYIGFVASVLPANRSMLHVFKKYYPHAQTSTHQGDIEIRMAFDVTSLSPGSPEK